MQALWFMQNMQDMFFNYMQNDRIDQWSNKWRGKICSWSAWNKMSKWQLPACFFTAVAQLKIMVNNREIIVSYQVVQ